MLRTELSNKNVQRVELDQSSRDTRLRLERSGACLRRERRDAVTAQGAPLSFHDRRFRWRDYRKPNRGEPLSDPVCPRFPRSNIWGRLFPRREMPDTRPEHDAQNCTV